MKHKAGNYPVECKYCGRVRMYRYHCHAKARVFCSRRCSDFYRRNGTIRNQFGEALPWTKEEDALLRSLYPSSSSKKELAEKLGRTEWSIKRRVCQLGLKKTKEALREAYIRGGRKSKGRPRPDFVKNGYRGSGEAKPFYGRTHSEETRRVLSEKAKELGTFRRLSKDPEFQRKRMKALHARPNKPEETLAELLEELYPGEYEYTGGGSFVIDGLCPDFVNVNGQKKIIEVFGEQYHDPDIAPRKISYRSTEKGRRKAFARFGYGLLVVWSKQLTKGGEQGRMELVEKIREFHEDLCD